VSSLSQSSLPHPSLSLRSAPLSLAGVVRILSRWQSERSTRAALARLDDHLREDIGLDRRIAQPPLPRLFPAF
jgi:uncharacterized protein YjiS (DUF1127 family)